MSSHSDEVVRIVHLARHAIHGIRLVSLVGPPLDQLPQSHLDSFQQASEQILVGVSDSPRVCVESSDGSLDMVATLAMV